MVSLWLNAYFISSALCLSLDSLFILVGIELLVSKI